MRIPRLALAIATALVVLPAAAPATADPGGIPGVDPGSFHALFVLNVGGAAGLGYGDLHLALALREHLLALGVAEANVRILLDDGHLRDGNGLGGIVQRDAYPAASKVNAMETLGAFAVAARGNPSARLLYFQSSHGGIYSSTTADRNLSRLAGSVAHLHESRFRDHELGNALRAFPEGTPMLVAVDCSLCGGFSDSLSPGVATPDSAGVVAPGRVVLTGCTMTTECFGEGSIFYTHYWRRGLLAGAGDGYRSAVPLPGVPAAIHDPAAGDGLLSAEELYWRAVEDATTYCVTVKAERRDCWASAQQQFQMKDRLEGEFLLGRAGVAAGAGGG